MQKIVAQLKAKRLRGFQGFSPDVSCKLKQDLELTNRPLQDMIVFDEKPSYISLYPF